MPWLLLLLLSRFGIAERAAPTQVGHAAYQLAIEVHPEARSIRVRGTVTLAPQQSSDSVHLVLWSRADSVRFQDAADSLADLPAATDSADGDRGWTLRLPAGVTEHGARIHFSYVLRDLSSPQISVYSDHAYAGGGGELWYPRQAFDSMSVGTLRFLAPPGWTVIAPGSKRGDTFETQEAAHFGFAAGKYTRYTSGVDSRISLYLLEPRPFADTMVTRAAAIMAELEARFGPRPTSTYAIAEVRFGGAIGGLSEFGFFLADRAEVDRRLPLTLIAHEMGHAWWGNRVPSRAGPGRMMLTEAIASFGMLRALEATDGPRAALAFRTGTLPGAAIAQSSEEYFRMAAAGLEIPLAVAPPRGQRETLQMHRLANTKGMFVYDMLAREMGEAAFGRALAQIAERYAGTGLDWRTFESELTRRSREPINWFFEQWLRRVGAPEYTLSDWKQQGSIIQSAITQTSPFYRALLDVEARNGAGQRARTSVRVAGAVTSFKWTVPFKADTLVLDPDYRVLRWTPERRARANTLAPLTRADWERRFGDRRSAVDTLRAILTRIAQPDTLGMEALASFSLARGLLDQNDTNAASSAALGALLAPNRPDNAVPQMYLLLARLYRLQHKDAEMRSALDHAVSADARVGNVNGAEQVRRSMLADTTRS